MKKNDYKKWLPKAVVILLCFFFIGGTAWGLDNILSMEGTMVPVDNKEGLASCPKTTEEAVAFLNSVVEKAVYEKPKLSSSDSFVISGDSISSGGPQQLTDTLKFIKESAQDSLEKSFSEISADYGEGFSHSLWKPDITADDVENFKCSYIYYVCPSCGAESDTPLDYCEKCGSERSYEMHYRSSYTIELKLKERENEHIKTSAIIRNFRIRSKDEIDSLIDTKLKQYLVLDSTNITYRNATIIFTVDRLTNQITILSYSKDADVSAGISFAGCFRQLGESNVGFSLFEKVDFNFNWPGISLSAHTMSIDRKTTDNLLATLTCADSAEAVVTWTSSDDSIASVDDEGNITTAKKVGTVTVTASFKFLGKTYTDSCTVNVRKSVKKLTLSKKSLKLKSDETYRLKATVSPKKADIRSVKWYTTDESVVTVDAAGTVRAVGCGTANVYALSDDGYYKSTCRVEVKQK